VANSRIWFRRSVALRTGVQGHDIDEGLYPLAIISQLRLHRDVAGRYKIHMFYMVVS